MADDVQVRFGGDASGIRTAAQQAQQAARGFAEQTRAQNATARASYADLSAQIRDTNEVLRAIQASSEDTASVAAQARAVAVLIAAYEGLSAASESASRTIGSVATALSVAAVTTFREQATSASADAEGLATAVAGAAASMRDYFTSVAYAERGQRLFEQANEGTRAAIGQTILAVEQWIERLRLSTSELARNELTAISAAGNLDRFREALNGASANSFLVDTTAELMKIPGLSQEAAAEIEVMLTSIPEYSTQANGLLVTLLQSMSRTGDEAVENAKKITSAFNDTEGGGQALGKILTDNLKDFGDLQVAAGNLAKQMQPQQAAAMLDTIIAKLRDQNKLQQAIVEENEKDLRSYPLIGNALASIYEWQTKSAEKQRELSGLVEITTANIEMQSNALHAAADAQQRQVDLEKLLSVETTRAGREAAAQQDIATLTARKRGNDPGIQGSERDLMIRTVYGEAGGESDVGMEAVANVIRNRVTSGYRDAQTYSDAIMAPRQFSVWNEGDKAGDRAMALDVDSAVYKRIGEIVDQVTSGAGADPTSGATSYYNPRLASPTWGADMSNRKTIGNHVFGNTPESPPVSDDAQQAAINERLAQRRDTLRQIADEARGGTQADLASLDIAEKAVTTARDQVAEARQLVAARQKDVDAAQGGTEGAQIAARRALAEAQQALRQREIEQDRAAAQLQVATMQAASAERLKILNDELSKEQEAYQRGSAEWNRLEARKVANTRAYEQAVAQQRASSASLQTARMETGSADRLRILNEALAQEQALHERGSTEWNRLEAQKVANTRAYEQFIAQERATAEDTAYRNARRSLDDRLADIRLEARERGLTFAERRNETASVLSQIETLEREHQERLAQIWGAGTNQYRQAQAQLERIAAESTTRRTRAEREMQRAEYQDTKQAYEQIGSTLTSNAFSAIQGQATIAQAAKNTAMSIVQSYVQAKVKLVADWLAGVTTHQVGETAKTAATTAGVTARTTAEGAGAATSLATQAGAIVKSIMASAAETFAGIFGFLSPLLGPAAVGPAVAGEAAVAAVAASVPAFATGAWSLPSDQLALVHKNEMIVPAAVAEPLRRSGLLERTGDTVRGPRGIAQQARDTASRSALAAAAFLAGGIAVPAAAATATKSSSPPTAVAPRGIAATSSEVSRSVTSLSEVARSSIQIASAQAFGPTPAAAQNQQMVRSTAERSAPGTLPSFAVGAWSLPNDMVANVHRGEMIVPAQAADPLRRSGLLDRAGDTVRYRSDAAQTVRDSQDVARRAQTIAATQGGAIGVRTRAVSSPDRVAPGLTTGQTGARPNSGAQPGVVAAARAQSVAIDVRGSLAKMPAVTDQGSSVSGPGSIARPGASVAPPGTTSPARTTDFAGIASTAAIPPAARAQLRDTPLPNLGPIAATALAAQRARASDVTSIRPSTLPSFAIGSWSLPSDIAMQGHQGEMIVPAAATPWAQSLMANAASSSGEASRGAGGTAWNGDAHFHVSAMDAQGVKRFFHANARHIIGAINEGIRTGSHLGMTKLRSPVGV